MKYLVMVLLIGASLTAVSKTRPSIKMRLSSRNPAQAQSFQLRFGLKGQIRNLTLESLRTLVPERSFEVKTNPAYNNENMAYRGFPFYELLSSLKVKLEDYKIVITCADGYRPVLEADIFNFGQALLAYREIQPANQELKTEDGLWTKAKLGDHLVTPGPLYLVWNTTATYPDGWPFQISEITLVPKKDFKEYELIAPKGAYSQEVSEGSQLFSKNCNVCHSINYVGPKGKAPDLRYVTGYRSEDQIRKILRDGRGVMPSFAKQLSRQEVSNIILYLKNIGAD